MYVIDSAMEVPDIGYLVDRVEQSLKQGIVMRDLSKLYNTFKESRDMAKKNLYNKYGIDNPNSAQQILNHFNKTLVCNITDAIQETGTRLERFEIMPLVYGLYNKGITETDSDTIRSNINTEHELEEATIRCINILLKNDIINAMLRDGKWTTNGSAMTSLALKGYSDAVDILTYRKAKKYSESVMSFITEIRGDGRVHPILSLGKTNRINYSAPALMNIPKRLIWDMIGPRRPGNMLVSVDIKNQEPWIMINILGIEKLKQLLDVQGGLYERVFNEIFNRDPEGMERDELKVSWNAMTYGASIYGIKEICRHIPGEQVYKYFNSFPEFKKYKAKCAALAKNHVQTSLTYFGTKLYADEIGSKLKRVLMDIPIQGTGTDILALLVKHFDEEVEEREIEDSIGLYYTRHDEVILEIQQEFVQEHGKEKVFDIIRDIFEHRIDDWEPFRVEIKELEPDMSYMSNMLIDEE